MIFKYNFDKNIKNIYIYIIQTVDQINLIF